jgi:2-C-methyl-D-erythritol 4-phosphate cytidylyltransferase
MRLSQKSPGMQPDYYALIPSAGVGARMGVNLPKQYLPLAGKSVLQHTVNGFLSTPEIQHIYIVVSPDDAYVENNVELNDRVTILRCGGETRSESVRNGLDMLQVRANDFVLVHDAARPGITSSLIQKLINTIGTKEIGGLLALPVVDTVKRVHNGEVETISREGLWLAQTPQMFSYQLLVHALNAAPDMTDEASAIETLGLTPILVEGHARNRKLTLPDDVDFLQNYIR